MTFGHAIRRMLYYLGDIPMLWRTLFTYIRAYFLVTDNNLLEFANPITHRKHRDMERIRNCVGVCFRLGSMISLKNTCLIHSVVLCRLLNQHGFHASIVFATKKNKESKMIGHCWVTVNNRDLINDWQVIFNYP